MRSQLDDFATYQLASFYILLPVLELPPYQMSLAKDVLCYTHLSSRNARVRTQTCVSVNIYATCCINL